MKPCYKKNKISCSFGTAMPVYYALVSVAFFILAENFNDLFPCHLLLCRIFRFSFFAYKNTPFARQYTTLSNKWGAVHF